jgi:hypothetical protein
MSSHAFDDMNDFFDFDQLEHDHGTKAIPGLNREHNATFAQSSPVLCMDWMAGGAIDVSASHDFDMHKVFDSASYLQNAQWPLTDTKHQLLTGVDAGVYPHLIASLEGASIAKDTTPGGRLSSNITPSSSSLASALQELASDPIGTDNNISGDQQMSLPTLAIPGWEITSALGPAENHASARALTAMPLRQPSTADWKPASAKRKGPQSRIPLEARQILDDEFIANPYPCSWEMDIIAHQANLDVKKVRNWFNNTRARKKGGGNYLRQCLVVAILTSLQMSMLLGKSMLTRSVACQEQDCPEIALRHSNNTAWKIFNHPNH